MKTVYLLLFCFFMMADSLFAQSLKNTEKIIQIYGEEWYNLQASNGMTLLELMDKYIDFGFKVEKVDHNKYSELAPLTEVPLLSKNGSYISVQEFLDDYNSSNFNPLKYRFFPQDNIQVYKLNGADYIIYIIDQKTIMSSK